ncbi:class I SAM-dependent methyltransferase [bacterium]|nr:class I SAM-dependent methyltransferase [bacterium]
MRDTIVCLNVLEHIADDARALANMYHLLAPGGRRSSSCPPCAVSSAPWTRFFTTIAVMKCPNWPRRCPPRVSW